MAYAGTTAVTPQVPQMHQQSITGQRSWIYVSTHISSDIEAANFFTDGKKLGMKPGDFLTHISVSSLPLASTAATAGVVTMHQVLVVGSTTTDLGVGTTIGLGA